MNNRTYVQIYASDIAPSGNQNILWMDLASNPYGSVVKYWNGTTWVIEEADYSVSPNLTGIPTAPTATAGTSTTQIATTAFVSASVALKVNKTAPQLLGLIEYADNDAAIAAEKQVGDVYRTGDILKIVHA